MNYKIISPHGFDQMLATTGNPVTLVTNAKEAKQAARCSISQQMLEDHMPDKDHFALHVVALGDEERWGFNSNADSFPSAMLAAKHASFVSDGHYFREHKNDHKKHSIGGIVASSYNPEQGWVELIVHGRLKPEPGAPLTAEKEYETIRAGGDLFHSMCCMPYHDECSICGNKTKRTSDWCNHLKLARKQFNSEARKYAFARNFDGRFMDISHVEVPAEKIAHTIVGLFNDGTSVIRKSASASSSAPIYTGEHHLYPEPNLPSRLKAAAFALDPYIVRGDPVLDEAVKTWHAYRLTPDAKRAFVATRTPVLMRKLAALKIVLPMGAFADAEGLESPSILHRALSLIGGDDLPSLPGGVSSDAFSMCDKATENLGAADGIDRLMQKVKEQAGLDGEQSVTRVIINIKSASAQSEPLAPDEEAQAHAWVSAYKAYKLAALENIRQLHGSSCFDAPTLRFLATA